LVKLNRAVARLSDQRVLPETRAGAPLAVSAAPSTRAGRATVPVFATAAPTAPAVATVVESLGSTEARQKIQEVIASLKEQRRQDKLVRSSDRKEKIDVKMQEVVGPELGLAPDEARRAHDALARLVSTRKRAVQELQSGAKSRTEAKSEIDGAARAADEQLKEILGDKRLVAYRDLRRKIDRALATP
jgi:hypothetical protein